MQDNSIVLTMPYRQVIEPESATFGDFTVFFAGDTGALRNAFASRPDYWLRNDASPEPTSPNGFQQQPGADQKWERFGLATVLPPEGSLPGATDDWPFLYLRKPMIPTLSWRGMLIMGGLGLLLIFLFLPRQAKAENGSRLLNIRMFFLGAGFMLIETKAVVTMALLFGGTWVVNSVVFMAVLMMILLANLWTFRIKPTALWPYYTGLLISLALNVMISLDSFLGMNRAIQVLGASLLVFVPIFFAGVIFAGSFRRTTQPDRAFGINVAGAMVGGLAEYGRWRWDSDT